MEPAGLALPERSTTAAEESVLDDGPPATSADPVRAELITDGDEICADELGAFTGLRPSRQVRATIEQLKFVEQSYRRTATRLRALPVPEADRDELELIFVQIEQVADAMLSMVDAIRVLDQAAVDAANQRIDDIGSDVEQRLRDYGFLGCADG